MRTFYRYKTILGNKVRSRHADNRHVETVLGCNILNRFLEMEDVHRKWFFESGIIGSIQLERLFVQQSQVESSIDVLS